MDPDDDDDEKFLDEIANTEIANIKENFESIYDVWRILGIGNCQKALLAKRVWAHVNNLLNDIFEEEDKLCNDSKKCIEDCMVKIQELSKALSVSPKEVTEQSLVKQEELLRQELDGLSKLKHHRINSYRDFKKFELQLCRILNMPEHELSSNTGVPSEQDLEELKERIVTLKREKEMRLEKFFLIKKELTTIWEETELIPETPLEKEILSEKGKFSLSNETFEALEEIISKAKKKKMLLENKKKALINILNALWNRLKVDERKRVEFLSNHVDYSLSTLISIQQEIEKIKKGNIRMFINSLREELSDLWRKCCVSESSRQEFKLFTCSEATDEILEAHEAEVQKWKSYYEDAQHIIDKIDKRKRLCELKIDLENKANYLKRLENRKGNLLQEENRRKRLQKELSALENDIFKDIEVYEGQKGSPFLYYGEDFRQFVNRFMAGNIQKEKQAKNKQHLLQLNAMEGTPRKLPLMTTPKSSPRKILKSTNSISLSHTPAAHGYRMMSSTSVKSQSKVTKLFSSRPDAIQEKYRKMILSVRNQSQLMTSSDSTAYADFARELDRSSSCILRSSVLATRKPGGTRISLNNNKSKNLNKSAKKRRSGRNYSQSQSTIDSS